jgi:hypothetical protein
VVWALALRDAGLSGEPGPADHGVPAWREKAYVSSVSPSVRRLCICVDASRPGLLDTACRIGGFGRLYTEHIDAEGLDLGFASPGVDEAVLVTDMIAALRAAAKQEGIADVATRPTLAAFHVGITRVEGDDLRGDAVTRIRELLRNLAAAVTVPAQALVVCISAGLFDDIRGECGFSDRWEPLAPARAWFRGYQAADPALTD